MAHGHHLDQRLLKLKAEVERTSPAEIQRLRSLRGELKGSLKDFLHIKSGSEQFSRQVQSLLNESNLPDLEPSQVKTDILFTINLCLHALSEEPEIPRTLKFTHGQSRGTSE